MIAVLFLLLGALSGDSFQPRVAPVELKLRLLEEINRARTEEGLSPVIYSPALSDAADAHCREMLLEGYISHWNRAGHKPYLRYAWAGSQGSTAENITSLHDSDFPDDLKILWVSMFTGHQRFMAEVPPDDGHRRSILDPRQTHVGIGVAYNHTGMRLIEVYEARYVDLKPLPPRATLRDSLLISGRVVAPGLAFEALTVFFEPLPAAMTISELRRTKSYGLPNEHRHERAQLFRERYTDGTRGSVELAPDGSFRLPLIFWKGKPGVYTVGVWVRERGEDAFLGGLQSLLVE